MTTKHEGCSHEEAIITAVQSGNWSPELEAHRNGCMCCAELTLVVSALVGDAAELSAIEAPLPDPSPVWLRARLASKERDFRRATRAIVWVQRAAVGVALAIGMAFAPGFWTTAKNAILNMGLEASVAGIPRAAGSPMLVVVCSMVVLGMLAFWELTVIRDP